jgi:AraC family transcriptional regulator
MMKASTNRQLECTHLPVLSSREQGWENLLVEQFQSPAGEARFDQGDEHAIYLSLAPRPVHALQVQGSKTYAGLYGKGDISIMPAQVSFFSRWDSDDRFLLIQITSRFIQTVAKETINRNPDLLELLPEFQIRDPQLEAIGMLLLTELKQEDSSRLYIESLANVLAVHLVRQYAATKPQVTVYEGGLPQRQLSQVLDYINDHLDHDIKLADLAALLNMSQFHFSHLFKQAIGTSPYQYLLQQRIERAKQLLKQSDQPIMEIAFQCGFNNHSHLSQQFRRFTGMTPKAFRAN